MLLRRASLPFEADVGEDSVLPGLLKLRPLTVTLEIRGAANDEREEPKPAVFRLGDVGRSAWTFLSCLESDDGEAGLLVADSNPRAMNKHTVRSKVKEG